LVLADIHAAQATLDQIKDSLRSKYDSVDSVFVTGTPAAGILAKVRELKADCLVIGSHGHGAWHDLLFGSTTNLILTAAPCRIVVVPLSTPRPRHRPAERRLVIAQ